MENQPTPIPTSSNSSPERIRRTRRGSPEYEELDTLITNLDQSLSTTPLENGPTVPELTIKDNRIDRSRAAYAGLDFSIGAKYRADVAKKHLNDIAEAASRKPELTTHTPLTREEAVVALSYPEYDNEGESFLQEVEELDSPEGKQIVKALIELSKKHGSDTLNREAFALQKESFRRMETLGIVNEDNEPFDAYQTSISHQLRAMAYLYAKSTDGSTALAEISGDAIESKEVSEAIINANLGSAYDALSQTSDDTKLSPERLAAVKELLRGGLRDKDGELNTTTQVEVGRILTDQIDDSEQSKNEPASPERTKKPFWLKRVATVALINFQIARKVGFRKTASEKMSTGKDKAVASFNSFTTEFGNDLVDLQRKTNDKLTDFTVEKIENEINTRYREAIRFFGDGMSEAKHELEKYYHTAKNRKLARKRLVDIKVNEINADIANRQTQDITKKISRNNGQGYWV